MKSAFWIAYQSNRKQAVAIRGRDAYYSLRAQVRRLRRQCPTHYDVLWYENSLGIDAWTTDVVKRGLEWGRVAHSGITGPVGKLP